MKHIKKNGAGGGGGRKLPTEDEVEVAEILLNLPRLFSKSEIIGRYSFTWGLRKKRSVLDMKSRTESLLSPSPSTLSQPRMDDGVTEKVTACEADKSPSTPLCFLPPSGNSVRKILKRKETNDLMEAYNRLQQEKENLMKKIKDMKTLHQELTSQNLELKARGQKINYPRNMEDFHIWNSPMKVVDQQHCHQQITMFAPSTPQLVVDPSSGKLVTVNGGGGRLMFNQIDPRVKIHGETYDFMASSQPLDQTRYFVMDNDLRVRTEAAAARKRRKLRMKENKKPSLAMKPSRAFR